MLAFVLLLQLAQASTPTPTPTPTPEDFFTLEALGDGVYAAVVVPRPPTYVFANSLVVISGDGVLVVDTQQSPEAARALIEIIRGLTDRPVRYVVNTHWHGDHVYGNQAYREAFPEVVFIGHATSRVDLLDAGAAMLEEELATLPDSIREREEALDRPDLDEQTRARLEYSRDARTRYLASLRTLRLLPPNLTFSDALTLHLGERRVEVKHLGAAHTRGDVIVYLPAEKVLAAGDLLEDAFPYFGHAYPSGWARALEAIGEYDASVFLPSHGPVLRDRELLEVETGLLRALVDEVAASVSAGRNLEETLASVTLETFRSAFGSAGFEASVREAVGRAFEEATGGLRESR